MDEQIDNYVPVTWDDVSTGDRVWLRGSHSGRPVVYGPHTVWNVSDRRLKNSRGVTFMNFSENLMRHK